MRGYAREAGRDPASIGIETRISVGDGGPEAWSAQAKAWQDLGATHLSVNTMNAGFTSPQQHIDAIGRFKEVVSG
jgi:hypothetical protein